MEEDDNEFPLLGEDTIEDPKNPCLPRSGLFHGKYTMEGNTVDISIMKGVEINQETYKIMKNVQHNSLIPHLFYYAENNHGSLVIPLVETSFEHWITTVGRELLFDQNGEMTSLFTNILVDVCDVVEKLLAKEIGIKNLDISNLYMANETRPRILVVVTEAEIQKNEVSKSSTWNPVKTIMDLCYKRCNQTMSYNASRYYKFIGSDYFTVKALKKYPLNWDNVYKGDYLAALIAAEKYLIKNAMKPTGIRWPCEKNGEKLDLLIRIIDQERTKGRNYVTGIPLDYVRLIRNIYKHFYSFSYSIRKELGSTQDGFLKKLEDWTPTIWQDIYDSVGWP